MESRSSASAGRPRAAACPGPRIIAHRGACAHAPENTHAAFSLARKLGADGIELDLQLSRDNVVVAYHDRTLRKVGGPRRRIHELTLNQLRSLDFGAWFRPKFRGELVPTLQEILERYRDLDLALELKTDGETSAARRRRLVDTTAELVGGAKRTHRISMLSFDAGSLRRFAQKQPDVPAVLNVDVQPKWGATIRRAMGHARVVCFPGRFVTSAVVEGFHKADRKVWVYRCDTQRVARRAQHARADAMITDSPQWLRRHLATLGG